MSVKLKRFTETAILPTYGSAQAAGADLYADTVSSIMIKPHETVLIGTGIGVALPQGFVGLLFARSGLATKKGLAPANKVGVIDADYRGEIKVALHNHSEKAVTIEAHERIAQFVMVPYVQAEYEEVEELDETVRGVGGFGSTGSC